MEVPSFSLSELPVFGLEAKKSPQKTATSTLGATMFRCLHPSWSGKPWLLLPPPLLRLLLLLLLPDMEKALISPGASSGVIGR